MPLFFSLASEADPCAVPRKSPTMWKVRKCRPELLAELERLAAASDDPRDAAWVRFIADVDQSDGSRQLHPAGNHRRTERRIAGWGKSAGYNVAGGIRARRGRAYLGSPERARSTWMLPRGA